MKKINHHLKKKAKIDQQCVFLSTYNSVQDFIPICFPRKKKIDIQEKVLQQNHAEFLRSLYNIANVLFAQGK